MVDHALSDLLSFDLVVPRAGTFVLAGDQEVLDTQVGTVEGGAWKGLEFPFVEPVVGVGDEILRGMLETCGCEISG